VNDDHTQRIGTSAMRNNHKREVAAGKSRDLRKFSEKSMVKKTRECVQCTFKNPKQSQSQKSNCTTESFHAQVSAAVPSCRAVNNSTRHKVTAVKSADQSKPSQVRLDNKQEKKGQERNRKQDSRQKMMTTLRQE
jgi:hypothetical protein